MGIIEKPEMGRYSYGTPLIKDWTSLTGYKIGAFCSIAGNVQIYLGGNHTIDWITMFPFGAFFPELGDIFHPGRGSKGEVIIGNDVWIGDNASVLSGSIIEDGCAIGASTVVAGHIPAYSVVVGNPGRVVRKRFTDEQILHLLEIKWWDWPIEKILENARLLMSPNIDEFITKHRLH
jgi:acetyltransferase-like isoleucine patch superfamily enzyme